MQKQTILLGALVSLLACNSPNVNPPEVPPGQPTPVSGQVCPDWVHNRHTVRGSDYEIWAFKLRLADKVEVIASTAVFDPITTMNPADRAQLRYTEQVFQGYSGLRGCDREAYHGPVYWYNRNGPEVFYTDAFGRPGGPIKQTVSLHDEIGIQMSQRSDGFQNQFKLLRNHCAAGLGLKN